MMASSRCVLRTLIPISVPVQTIEKWKLIKRDVRHSVFIGFYLSCVAFLFVRGRNYLQQAS